MSVFISSRLVDADAEMPLPLSMLEIGIAEMIDNVETIDLVTTTLVSQIA